MKIAVIGAGSTNTPELINRFLERVDSLPVDEIHLMDIDPERLQIVAGFIQRIITKAGVSIRIVQTQNSLEAISGADVIITQLRVGKLAARREDEYLGQRHNLVGHETIGIGGMSKALRTIPVILELCELIEKEAPEALVLNFTNPSGLVMQAIQSYAPKLKAAGVCNSAYSTKMKFLERLSAQHGQTYQAQDGELLTLGLNHLTWHFGFNLKGEDVWDEVFAGYLEQLRAMQDPLFNPESTERQRAIPNDFLEYYFQSAKKIALQKKWPPSPAEEVLLVEKDLLALYADPACDRIPGGSMQHDGANYSSVATSIIHSWWNDLGETHIANVAHQGQVKGWEKEWVLEMPCKVDRQGVRPIPTEPLPLYNYVLLEQVKQYEQLTVEAAVHGDRSAAFRALLAHPLGPTEEDAANVLEDILTINEHYLPQFFL